MARRIKRMTVIRRLIHWINFFSIIAAAITGFYIAHPYYQTLFAKPAAFKYVMAYNRLIHFIAAIFLDVTSIVIAYLYFFSRFEKTVHKVIPIKQNIIEFFEVIFNFLTLNRRKRFNSAQLDSFNAVYFTILHLLVFLMLFTGLQMYSWSLYHGASSVGRWWPWLLHIGTDWTLWVFGGPRGVRIVHHFTMWLIIVWAVFHIYYEVWRTIFWKEGDIAIAFGGYKFENE